MKTLQVHSGSPEATRGIGRTLGEHCQPGDLILLVGDLGTGKTTLTQGIAQGLGVKQPARSPTFVLVAQYTGRLTLFHADLYRVNDPLEALELGLDESERGTGVCVVEWAERAPDAFSDEHLQVRITSEAEDSRLVTLLARGARYEALLQAAAQSLGALHRSEETRQR
ncbi:MAG: tRNA (adenosine(37)-N6)-threonylcarbamoyltransferase complex ATPase subunit type 1 TsaE [SAR202 cluster bacterium]|nr:tRNA (adenosine(37)-N6)-threonylcarbamoyltransferase complex ATPase subunit type 1 TsaE [SAR202 cluster bacterium]